VVGISISGSGASSRASIVGRAPARGKPGADRRVRTAGRRG
jgi:hypothetical protein